MIEKIATKLSPFLIAGGMISACVTSNLDMTNYLLRVLAIGGELGMVALGGGMIGRRLVRESDEIEKERQRAYSEIEQKLDALYH